MQLDTDRTRMLNVLLLKIQIRYHFGAKLRFSRENRGYKAYASQGEIFNIRLHIMPIKWTLYVSVNLLYFFITRSSRPFVFFCGSNVNKYSSLSNLIHNL
jgi:hypothetical protein